jgi:hypothetical protein
MAKIIGVIFYALFLCKTIKAQQQNNKNKLVYAASMQIGLVEGDAEKSAIVLHVINGVKYGSWFGGIGVGIDQYANKRSLPMYIALQKDFLHKKHRPFLYSNIGYNISKLKEAQKSANLPSYKELNGWYYDIGVGYKYVFFKNTALGISAGYSLKQQGEQYTFGGAFPPPFENFPEKYEHTLRRISFKLNYWF